jgi:hypothetical protein
MAKDLIPVPFPKGDGCPLAKVRALRELQSASGEELSALMPSILDNAFKGEL